MPGVIDLAPVLRQQFIQQQPRLRSKAGGIRQIYHLLQFQTHTDDHLGFHIAQREVVVCEIRAAFLDGCFLRCRKIHGPKIPGRQPPSADLPAASPVKQFCQPGKLQGRGAKRNALPLGKAALELFQFRDEYVVSRVGFDLHLRRTL